MTTFDETCSHANSAPAVVLSALPESQAGLGRHKCTNCAYGRGQKSRQSTDLPKLSDLVKCIHGSVAIRSAVETLPDSQAGSGRHKCVICAYAAGRSADFVMSTSVAEPVDGEVLSLEQLLAKIELPSGKSVSARKFVPRKVSFTDLSDTGAAGELVALNRERERLNSAGRADLSAKVLHVSRELGDGAGYDILSFALDESELYVEVKTTTGPPDTPFYITANELAFAKKASKSYKLVRLYSFEKATGTCGEFVISADELASLTTVPVTFQCLVRK